MKCVFVLALLAGASAVEFGLFDHESTLTGGWYPASAKALYLSSIGEFPLHAKVAFLWTFCPLGFHGLGKGTKNSGVNFMYNLFKNLPVIMLELWMSTSYASDNPMGKVKTTTCTVRRAGKTANCSVKYCCF